MNEDRTNSSDEASISSAEVDEHAVQMTCRELAMGSENSASRDLPATGASARDLPIGQASRGLPVDEEDVQEPVDPRIAKILEEHKSPPQIFQSSWSQGEVFDSQRSMRARMMNLFGDSEGKGEGGRQVDGRGSFFNRLTPRSQSRVKDLLRPGWDGWDTRSAGEKFDSGHSETHEDQGAPDGGSTAQNAEGEPVPQVSLPTLVPALHDPPPPTISHGVGEGDKDGGT